MDSLAIAIEFNLDELLNERIARCLLENKIAVIEEIILETQSQCTHSELLYPDNRVSNLECYLPYVVI